MNFEWLDALLAAWRDTLLRSSVQATIGVSILLIIERAVPWLAANWRSWLWRCLYLKVALVLLVPIAWTIPLLPSIGTRTAAPPSTSQLRAFMELHTEAIQEPIENRQAENGFKDASFAWSGLTFCVWSVCVAACMVMLAGQWKRVRHLVRGAVPCPDALMCKLLGTVCRQMRISRVPALMQVTGICSPMVVGYRKPLILWPSQLEQHADQGCSDIEDRRMALAHETAHMVRFDLWWNLLAASVNTLLWFHPLMRIAGRRYLAAQEAACDEMAVRRAELDPVRFAELLIRISGKSGLCDWTPAGVPLIQGHGIELLRERLKTMQHIRSDSVGRLTAMIAFGLGLVFAILPWSIGFAEKPSEKLTPKASSNSEASNLGNGTSASSSASGSASAFGSAGGSASGTGMSRGGSFGGGQSSGGSKGQTGGTGYSGGSVMSNSSSSVTISNGPGESSISNGESPRRVKGSSKKSNSNTSNNSSSSSSNNGVQVTTTRDVTDDGEEIRVTVQEKLRDIQVRQSDADGIEVFIRPTKKNPDQTTTNVTAATAEELKQQYPQAYEVFRKYLQSNLKKIRSNKDASQKSLQNVPSSNDEGSNLAQELMKRHLQGMLDKDDLPDANRVQIEQMLKDLK